MLVIASAACLLVLRRKKPKQKRDVITDRVPTEQPINGPLNSKEDEIPERRDPVTVRVDPEISVRPDPKCDDCCDQYTPDS